MIPIEHILLLSALLFIIGVLGVMLRRNVIVMFMSIELMLNAVNLSFVTFARSLDSMTGVIFIFFYHCGCRCRSGGRLIDNSFNIFEHGKL